MKLRVLLPSLFLGLGHAFAAEPVVAPAPSVAAATSASSPTDDLKALIARVETKLQQGKRTSADLTEELAAFDALLVKYREQKTDEVAQILYMEAGLYAQVFQDNEKALQLVRRLKTDFPATKLAGAADRLIESLEGQMKIAETQAALIGKPAPELHFKWSNREGLKTLSDLKGKVVVLDFWATWCGPCVASFPNVRELVTRYKDLDVAIVGVTSVQGVVKGLEPQTIDTSGDPAKEMALMKDYIKAKEITWTVAFSEEEVFNPAYGIRGIPYIAILAPDGTVRHTGLHPAMPADEKYSKIDALLKEFGKKLPAALASGK